MEKTEIIKLIKDIIENNGSFNVCELGASGVVVGELGKFVGIAESFNKDYVEINVYEPGSFSSDEVDSYEEQYEDLSEDVLQEILFLAEIWEAEELQTEKRISN
jgi:hypothetical protein